MKLNMFWGDSPPIIRSLKLHWQLLVFHTWKVVRHTVPDNVHHPQLSINPFSPELNPISYLLALLAHDFLHVSRIRVNAVTSIMVRFAKL
jgi:transposase